MSDLRLLAILPRSKRRFLGPRQPRLGAQRAPRYSINGNEAELPAPPGRSQNTRFTFTDVISEREGHVPVWLWLVVVLLLVWGIYYLVAYWNTPIPAV